MFGTRMTDRFFTIDTGGDVAFLTGVLKVMADDGLTDDAFIATHTSGLAGAAAHPPASLARRPGALERRIGR